jgi:hypothetical protein
MCSKYAVLKTQKISNRPVKPTLAEVTKWRRPYLALGTQHSHSPCKPLSRGFRMSQSASPSKLRPHIATLVVLPGTVRSPEAGAPGPPYAFTGVLPAVCGATLSLTAVPTLAITMSYDPIPWPITQS